MFPDVFTVPLTRNLERIYNQEERQTKYKVFPCCSDITTVNIASNSSDVNRIVCILFCLKEQKVLLQFFHPEFLPLISHTVCCLPAAPKETVGSCTGLNHMFHQLNKWVDYNSILYMLSDKNEYRSIHIFFESPIFKPTTPGLATLAPAKQLASSIFLIGCVQRGTTIASYEDHGIFCSYWKALWYVISFAIC